MGAVPPVWNFQPMVLGLLLCVLQLSTIAWAETLLIKVIFGSVDGAPTNLSPTYSPGMIFEFCHGGDAGWYSR